MAAKFYFLGSNVIVTSSWTDNATPPNPVTPSPLTVVVTDPTGASVTVGAPALVSTGNYQAQVAASTLSGVYSVTWTAVVSGFTQVDQYTYTVLSTVPVVSVSDFELYLGVSSIDQSRATLVLSSAQSLCEAIVSPLPNGAESVVLDVAARAFTNPTNVQSQAVAPFSVAYGAVSGGLWLTNANKATLRMLAGGSGGAFTIDTMPATAGAGLPWWDYGNLTPFGDFG